MMRKFGNLKKILPNPRVFFDISIGGKNAGRMIFELFDDDLAITSENFRCLCTGETGLGYYLKPRWYKNSPFHRIIPDFMCHGGDFNRGDGFGGESIYGQFFRDESFLYKHSKRGVLSMARGRNLHTNNSQFFITFNSCPWLDGKNVVFGQLESGEEVLDFIEEQGTEAGWVKRPVNIWNCGEIQFNSLQIKRKEIKNNLENDILLSKEEKINKNKTADSFVVLEKSLTRPEKNDSIKSDMDYLPPELYKRSKFDF